MNENIATIGFTILAIILWMWLPRSTLAFLMYRLAVKNAIDSSWIMIIFMIFGLIVDFS